MAGDNDIVYGPFSFLAVKTGPPLVEGGGCQCWESPVHPELSAAWFCVCWNLSGMGKDAQEDVHQVGCFRERVRGLGVDP